MFNCQKAKDAIFNRKRKFLTNYASLDNLICYVIHNCVNAKYNLDQHYRITAYHCYARVCLAFYIVYSFVICSIAYELS